MKKTNTFLTLLFVCAVLTSYGQGCSDAGFCTLEGIQNSELQQSDYNNKISIGSSYGFADHNISVIAPFFSYNRNISQKLSVNTKLTSISQRNEFLQNSGLSDAFLTIAYRLNTKIGFTSGLKVPLNDGNQIINNTLAYPLNFQTSLGTTDLIAAVAVNLKKLQLNLAVQQPITQTKNTFLSQSYDSTHYLSDFQSTNLLNRKGDILIRATYGWQLREKINFSSSLLSIYHLGSDSYIDTNNNEKVIEGSDGLTININLFLDYTISKNSNLNFNIGSPLTVREVRPDGLTRSFIATLSYGYQF
jgi:hypothetical protein